MVTGKTVAVIVAIEEYPRLGTAWKLTDAGKQALEFTRWVMNDLRVPKENVQVFANGESVEAFLQLGVPEGRIAEPVSANLNTFLPRLGKDLPEGDTLLIYWLGHGFVSRDSARRLILADAVTENKTNLDVDQLVKLLRSSQAGGFVQQYAIIDACAKFFETLQSTTDLPPGGLSQSDQRTDVKQSFYFAASVGQYATVGSFGPRVLDRLKRFEWPPDPIKLRNEIEDVFKDWAPDQASQQPVWLGYFCESADWASRGVLPTLDDIHKAARRARLPLHQLRTLTELAAACPSLNSESARTDLVNQLQTGKAIYRPEGSEADRHLDLMRIVAGAIEQGALAKLTDEIEKKEGNSDASFEFSQATLGVDLVQNIWPLVEAIRLPVARAQYIFRDSYSRASETLGSVDEMLQILLELKSQDYLVEFLLRLANERPTDANCIRLRDWVEQRPEWGNQRARVMKCLDRDASSQEYLQLEVSDKSGRLRVTDAWLWSASKPKRLSLEELENSQDLAHDVAILRAVSETEDAVLELFMPGQFMHLEKGLLARTNDEVIRDAEQEYPVILRWRERMVAKDSDVFVEKGLWKKVSKTICHWRSGNPARADWLPGGCDPLKIVPEFKKTKSGELIGFPFPSSDGTGRKHLISVIRNVGLPYACWPRDPDVDLPNARQVVSELIDMGFERVPRNLQALRHKADILLFWDDPERNPYEPKFREVKQQ